MKMIESTRNVNIKAKNEPLKPIARRRSRKKMQMYINPTSLVTNIPKRRKLIKNLMLILKCHSPLSSVAFPGFVHGKKPGHKYAYSCNFLPNIPKPGTVSKGTPPPACGAPCTLP